MDGQRQRHPGACRDPDPGELLDSRVRGNDQWPYAYGMSTIQST
jgi:hypothetical protein